MTAISPREDEAVGLGLYKTEKEIARILGVSPNHWRETARQLEREGLPGRDPLFDHRRYWPAVAAFLDRRAGLAAPSKKKRQWEEHFDVN